ncbi:MAG: hypothetical protein WEB09_09020 [Nitriliruptor sp.]
MSQVGRSFWDMMLRRCQPCGGWFPLAAFAWRRVDRGLRDTYCYRCRSAYHRAHYQQNRERYIAMAAARRDREVERRTRQLLKYFATHPCVDCGETDPIVLEFDHIGTKRFGISDGLRNRPWDVVLEEIAACEVVCANCHRRRTYRRGNALRFRLGEGGTASEHRGSYRSRAGSLRRLAGVAQW